MDYAAAIALILGIISIIGVICSIGVTWGSTKRDLTAAKNVIDTLNTKVECLDDKLEDFGGQLAKLNTQIRPFWNIIETKLASMLHSPHTLRYDELLMKFHDEMPSIELNELHTFLEQDLEESKINNNLSRALTIALVLSRVTNKQALAATSELFCHKYYSHKY